MLMNQTCYYYLLDITMIVSDHLMEQLVSHRVKSVITVLNIDQFYNLVRSNEEEHMLSSHNKKKLHDYTALDKYLERRK